MSAPRRPAFLPALAIVLIAGALAACGVKGDLEPPASPVPKLSAQPAPAAGPATSKVFVEQSRIEGRNNHDILPQMPPKEWSKKSDYQPARGKSPAGSGRHAPEADPEKRFVLDWLL